MVAGSSPAGGAISRLLPLRSNPYPVALPVAGAMLTWNALRAVGFGLDRVGPVIFPLFPLRSNPYPVTRPVVGFVVTRSALKAAGFEAGPPTCAIFPLFPLCSTRAWLRLRWRGRCSHGTRSSLRDLDLIQKRCWAWLARRGTRKSAVRALANDGAQPGQMSASCTLDTRSRTNGIFPRSTISR